MGGKKLVIIAIWLVVLLAVGAVLRFFVFPAQKQQQLEATSSSSQYDYEVALDLDGFSGYAVLRSEEFQRRLRLDRVRIEYRDDGADYSQRIKGLANGDLDLAVFTLDSLISSSIDLGDLPGTVILVIDETAGADAIVARTSQVPNLQALDDPDARIIGTGNSPSEFLSRTVRANFDLPNMIPNQSFEGVSRSKWKPSRQSISECNDGRRATSQRSRQMISTRQWWHKSEGGLGHVESIFQTTQNHRSQGFRRLRSQDRKPDEGR